MLGTSPATPGDIGSFPVTIHRVADDVTKTASVDDGRRSATPIDYEITIATERHRHRPRLHGRRHRPRRADDRSRLGDRRRRRRRPDDHVGGDDADRRRRRSATTWRRRPATSAQCAAVGRVPRPRRGRHPLRPASTATPSPSTRSAASGRSSSTARSSPNLIVAEDGLVTVAGGYGGEPWVPQAIPDPDLPERRDRAAVVRPRAVGGRRPRRAAGPDRRRSAPRSSSGTTSSSSPTDDTVGPSVGTFQAWIYNTVEDFRPEMTFEYGDARRAARASPRSASRTSSATTPRRCSRAGDPSTGPRRGRDDLPRLRGPVASTRSTLGYSVTVDAGDAARHLHQRTPCTSPTIRSPSR